MRALLTLGLIGAIGYAINGTAEPAESAFSPSEQIEVHSVVVDEPQAIGGPRIYSDTPTRWGASHLNVVAPVHNPKVS